MKYCINCNTLLPLSQFNNDKTRKDGKYPYCKSCSRTCNRVAGNKFYRINKRRLLSKAKTFCDTVEGRSKRMLIAAKARAKKNNLPFNITIEDIIIPNKCPLLNVELTLYSTKSGKSSDDTVASLDRIIPELGYTKGNIQVISKLANVLKNKATKEQLVIFANNILKHYGEK